MFNQLLARSRIPQISIISYLQKMFSASLQAIANNDEEFMREYLESNLVDKILETNRQLAQKGLFLEVHRDVEGSENEFIPGFCDFMDAEMIQGLHLDRNKNGTPENYHIWWDKEPNIGISVYTHHKYSNPDNFIDPEENKRIYDDYGVAMIRLLVSIKTPLVLNIVQKEFTESPDVVFGDYNPQNDKFEEDFRKFDPAKDKQSGLKFFRKYKIYIYLEHSEILYFIFYFI